MGLLEIGELISVLHGHSRFVDTTDLAAIGCPNGQVSQNICEGFTWAVSKMRLAWVFEIRSALQSQSVRPIAELDIIRLAYP